MDALKLCVLVIALSGCASETVLQVPQGTPQDMRVTWVRGTKAEVAFYCQSATRRLQAIGGQDAVACTAMTAERAPSFPRTQVTVLVAVPGVI